MKFGLSHLEKMQLQTETCFEVMPDIEAVSLASKRALELDMLVDVRPLVAQQSHRLMFCLIMLQEFWDGIPREDGKLLCIRNDHVDHDLSSLITNVQLQSAWIQPSNHR